MPSFHWPSAPPLLTAAGMLVLGAGVLIRERASRESRAFLVLSLTVVVWQVGFAGTYAADDEAAAVLLAQAAWLGIPLIGPALFGFTAALVDGGKSRALQVRLAWAVGAVFVVTFTAGGAIEGAHRYAWGFYPRYGAAVVPFLVFFFATLGLSMRMLVVEHRRAAPGVRRARLRWLIIGFGISYVGVLDFLASFGISVYPVGWAAVLVFQGVAAWVIERYRLVDLTPSFAADQILATMADPLLVVDAEGKIRIGNRAVCDVLERTREEVLESSLAALFAPEDRENVPPLLGTEVVRDRELRLRTRSGDLVEVSLSASPLRDRTGGRAGTILIARDVRERKRGERALRENEERFRSLLENISDVILLLQADGTVSFASASLERVVGRLPEKFVGRPAAALLHPEDRPNAAALLSEVSSSPGRTVTGEYRVRHRNGTWRTVETTATNLLHDPAVRGIIVASHDVTDRREAEAALRDRDDQLRHAQRMEAVGRLAGGVAHDFNNLLTVINGQAELLARGLLEPEEEGEALAAIHGAGERAAGLTRQLLAFSRKQILQPRLLDLNRVVGDLEPVLRRLLGADVRLEMQLQQDIGSVRADRGQLEQVLLNLVVNARDAMPAGGPLTIATGEAPTAPDHTWAGAPGPFVHLTVRDAGVGMSDEVQAKAFEPFFTTKEKGKGTGLGLSTVYGIVKQSGGFVHLESAPGLGTTVRAYLPRVDGHATAEPAEDGARTPRGRATVLLVEDEPAVRTLVGRILSRHGYEVVEAADALEALRTIEKLDGGLDLLLTDVVMPHMSGIQLAGRLRAVRGELPVLYMSGYSDRDFGEFAPGTSGVHFLEKPFSPDRLVRAVDDALRASGVAHVDS